MHGLCLLPSTLRTLLYVLESAAVLVHLLGLACKSRSTIRYAISGFTCTFSWLYWCWWELTAVVYARVCYLQFCS